MELTHERRTAGLSDRLIITLLAIAALIPFAQTLGFGYVMDDTTVIRSNPGIDGWGSLLRVWTQEYGNTPHSSGLYRPVTMALFAVVWNAGGHWALWFHALAVAMHVIATVLVWRVLATGLDRWPAMFAALWFAVHPVHIEAVANVANSSEVLVAIWTGTLMLYLARVDERPARVSWSTAVIAGLLCLAAFLSKESGVTAPLLAALWLWGWRRRSSGQTSARQTVAKWWPALAACVVAAAFVFLLRALILGGAVTRVSIAAPELGLLSGPQRVTAMLSLGPTILGLLFWPRTHNPYYGPNVLTAPYAPWWAAATILFLLLVVLAAGWLAKRGDRRMLVAVGWICIAFGPASNLLVATGQILSERTLYVASIGAAMLVGLALEWAFSIAAASAHRRSTTALVVTAAAIVMIASATRTVRWAGSWRSNSMLFSQMVAADSASYFGYWMKAMDARYEGRPGEAFPLFERAYTMYPRAFGVIVDYSLALSQQGQHARAAATAAELMSWSGAQADSQAVGLYLRLVDRAYGRDSVIAAARRLMKDAPSPTAAEHLERALRGTPQRPPD